MENTEFIEWEKTLIAKVQCGNEEAINELMEFLHKEKAGIVYNIARKSTQYDRSFDDFRQEFMIGAFTAMGKADIDRSPIGFLVQKGIWQAMDYLRAGYRKNLMQHCGKCDSTTRPLTRFGHPECPKCGNKVTGTIDRYEMYTPVDYSDPELGYHNIAGDSLNEDFIASADVIDRFRNTLSGRVAEVYDFIMVHGIDRDSSTNYIKDIAERMDISTSNVNLRLRTIKVKWAEFVEDQERQQLELDTNMAIDIIASHKIIIEREDK